jgi:signal peptidase
LAKRVELLAEKCVEYDEQLDIVSGLLDSVGINEAGVFKAPDASLPRPALAPAAKGRAVRFAGNALFTVALVFILVLASMYGMGGNGTRNLFGFSVFNVLTPSMRSLIPPGSLVVTRQTDAGDIEIGDVITFMVGKDNSITHQVVGILENFAYGERGFETKGLDNQAPDKDIVAARHVVGKMVFHSPGLGGVLFAVSEHWLLVLLVLAGAMGTGYLFKYILAKKISGHAVKSD